MVAIKFKDNDYWPLEVDEKADDLVDQLVAAAFEAGWSPSKGQPVSEWAEDAALKLVARTSITNPSATRQTNTEGEKK